jgi:uncharacterized membrane protein HdeD (DUF308 family)
MNTYSTTGIIQRAAGVSIGWSIAMILLGFLALCLPFAAGIGVSIAVGWIIVFGGLLYGASALAARGAGPFVWRVLAGLVYVIGGLYLIFHPTLALASLTLAMALVFFFEGAMEILAFFQQRALPGGGWILVNGLVTLLLAYFIWRPWPNSSIWAIGTILGINLIFSGITRLSYSIAARKTLTAAI